MDGQYSNVSNFHDELVELCKKHNATISTAFDSKRDAWLVELEVAVVGGKFDTMNLSVIG